VEAAIEESSLGATPKDRQDIRSLLQTRLPSPERALNAMPNQFYE
jgi:hypothetical protein